MSEARQLGVVVIGDEIRFGKRAEPCKAGILQFPTAVAAEEPN